jgi:N-methylhydantoinase A
MGNQKQSLSSRLACDVGGTFTDFVFLDERGGLRLEKVLTTPDDPARGIFDGINAYRRSAPELVESLCMFVHGTTLVINALIERRGAATALITTKGFRDILEMRDGLRYDTYDLQLEFPKPLAPRSLRFEVSERILADGRVLTPLDEHATRQVIERIASANIKSVAVCLLHAYSNPTHERRIGELLAEHAPEIAVTLASELLPTIGEYRRTSTAVANAYVKPAVEAYVERVQRRLESAGFRGDFYVMHSAGGMMTTKTARQFPVELIESGPAGGVAAAIWWGKQAELEDLLCFDMGGTTAKLCVVANGTAVVTDEYEAGRIYRFKRGSGFPISVPVLDLLEIGTGGGSVAEVSSLGLLKVGPESAGAMPGPACYGRGGVMPTVTDADLVLGYLDPEYFLGGDLALRSDLAKDAISRVLAHPLGLTIEDAADGIHQLANENMATAARLHLAELGVDPRSLVLVAYGGAGPLHACGLATRLGCRTVLIPPAAGVMSALGMLVADPSMERRRTLKVLLDQLRAPALETVLQEVETELRALLGVAGRTGVISAVRSAEMRYVGQGYAVQVPIDMSTAGEQLPDTLRALFRKTYRELYGRIYDDVAIELLGVRVVARIEAANKVRLTPIEAVDKALPDQARKGTRHAYFGGLGRFIDCPVFDRYQLRPGHELLGPAVVEERETSAILPPGSHATVDSNGTLRITLSGNEE